LDWPQKSAKVTKFSSLRNGRKDRIKEAEGQREEVEQRAAKKRKERTSEE
jgi:hypothetical protein